MLHAEHALELHRTSGGATALAERDTAAPHPLTIAVLGDSGSMRCQTDTSWPEQMQRVLQAELGVVTDLHNFGKYFQTVRRSLHRHLPKTILLDPDIVMVGHGGAEALWIYPRHRRPSPRPAEGLHSTTDGPLTRTRIQRLVRKCRRLGFDQVMKHSPPGTDAVLLRMGFRTRLTPAEFEESLRELVWGILLHTHAIIVLTKMSGWHYRVVPFSARRARVNHAIVDRVAHDMQGSGRVILVQTSSVIRPGDCLLPDGVHLTAEGHRRFGNYVGHQLLQVMQVSQYAVN